MTPIEINVDSTLENADWPKRTDDTMNGLQSQVAAQARKKQQQESLAEGWEDIPRDEHGRWSSGGGGAAGDLGLVKVPAGIHPTSHHEAIINTPSAMYQVANPAGTDTQQQFKGADGHYTEQRQQLHKAIIGKMAFGLAASSKPTVFMTGGGSASGKTIFTKNGFMGQGPNAMLVDSDKIKDGIPEYRERLAAKDITAAPFAHEESSDISQHAIAHGATHRLDMVYDSTGDNGVEKLEKKVAQMRAGGHQIVAHYMTIPTEDAIARSKARAEDPKSDSFGRVVKVDDIRKLHAGVSKVFPEAVKRGLFDEATLWDNRRKGMPPTKVMSAVGKNMTIHDPRLWQEFLDKAK